MDEPWDFWIRCDECGELYFEDNDSCPECGLAKGVVE